MDNDFWIGDTVKMIRENLVGIYEGETKNGLVKVKIDGTIQETNLENLMPYELKQVKTIMFNDPKTSDLEQQAKFIPEIDLHIEILAPFLVNGSSISIIQKQKKSCREFLKQCIKYKLSSALIIHGKGSGVLKEIVLQELALYPEVFTSNTVNNGGGIEVIFTYKK